MVVVMGQRWCRACGVKARGDRSGGWVTEPAWGGPADPGALPHYPLATWPPAGRRAAGWMVGG